VVGALADGETLVLVLAPALGAGPGAALGESSWR
jgi:hypothetical protein